MDSLSIKRVWEDSDFFEIEVMATSELIQARVKSYTTSESIKELSSRLANFPKTHDDKYLWENGTRGDASTPYVSLEFWCENKRGCVIIEVYMELTDGASFDKHNCCFFVKTEVGLLNKFGKSLNIIDMPGTGQRVVLNQ